LASGWLVYLNKFYNNANPSWW